MQRIALNAGWLFSKQPDGPMEAVCLPHTWNAADGTDGGGDYHRGVCRYEKRFSFDPAWTGKRVFVEFCGANLIAEAFLNGVRLGEHRGGYSAFIFELTQHLAKENTLTVLCDNGYHDDVYPQRADFTFYGGIYRDVNLLVTQPLHFSLADGVENLFVTPVVRGGDAVVTVRAQTSGACTVRFALDGQVVQANTRDGAAEAVFTLKNVRLWQGKKDPYLYEAAAEIVESGEQARASFGCRSFHVDADGGFFLNGQSYPLRGVSRHQDRAGVGNALTRRMHEEDMGIVLKSGVNALRLAHYQQDAYFYELCDRYGIVVWAELPYITQHLANGNENLRTQLRELVMQNYNHPSICIWGLSNEITTVGGETPETRQLLQTLHDDCHALDPTRLTAIANLFTLEPESPIHGIADLTAYNLYFGWYVGEVEQTAEWIKRFRAANPTAKLAISEYGADANVHFQNSDPRCGDYSEGYQALYHEKMLEIIGQNNCLWASFAWNLFDFGADSRNEGGCAGQNQKGLVTFDRKTKKNAFYLYKAYFSDEPFVHLCGRRYAAREEEATQIKVYSNQPSVSLFVDGVPFETKPCEKCVTFQVPICGAHTIRAQSGALYDEMCIEKAEEPKADYAYAGARAVNWFEQAPDPAHYSVKDTLGALQSSPAAAMLLQKLMEKVVGSYGLSGGVAQSDSMNKMMSAWTLEQLLGQVGRAVSPEDVRALNGALQRIPKQLQ